MKKIQFCKFIMAATMLLGLGYQAEATLISAGNGTVSSGAVTMPQSGGAAWSQIGYNVPTQFSYLNVSDGVTGGSSLFATIASYGSSWAGHYVTYGVAFVLDLGSDQTMDSAAFWNYNAGGNATSSFKLSFATQADGAASLGNGDTVAPSSSITYNPTFAPSISAGPSTEQDFAFSGDVTARYVLLTISNPGVSGSNDRVGMSEIEFNSVPEPTSLGLCVGGIALLAARRRRSR